MPTRCRYRTISAMAVMALSLQTTAKPIDLAPRYTAGTTTTYVTQGITQMHMRVELLDLDEVHTVRKESGMSLTAVAVDSNGAAELAWVLHYVALEADGSIPGIAERIDYDSRHPQASSSPMASLFGPLIEHPVTIRVDAAGRVVAVTGLPAGAAAGPLGAFARDFLSAEAFAQLPMFVTAGAGRPAKVRSKWTQRMPVAMPLAAGTVDVEQEFVFERIRPRQKTAQIAMTGAAVPGVRQGAAPGVAIEVRKSAARGAYTWDLVAGALAEAETYLELDTSFPSVMGPMELRQTLSTTIRRTDATERKPHRGKRTRPTRDKIE